MATTRAWSCRPRWRPSRWSLCRSSAATRKKRKCMPVVEQVRQAAERISASRWMTAARSPPVSSSTIGKCAACRCGSRSVPRMWKKASVALARRDIPGRAGKSSCPGTQVWRPRWQTCWSNIQTCYAGKSHRLPRRQHIHDPKDYAELKQMRPERLGFSYWCGQPSAKPRSRKIPKPPPAASRSTRKKAMASASCAANRRKRKSILRRAY